MKVFKKYEGASKSYEFYIIIQLNFSIHETFILKAKDNQNKI